MQAGRRLGICLLLLASTFAAESLSKKADGYLFLIFKR